MNRCVHVLLDQLFADDDRIFVVVTIERHEAHEDISSKCELTQVGRCTVRNDLSFFDLVTHLDDRSLIEASTFVKSLVLLQMVDVIADFDFHRIDVGNFASFASSYDHGTVGRNFSLEARADDGWLSHQQRNRLALHVGAHECAISVVMLQERNQTSGHTDHLTRRDVHVMDCFWSYDFKVTSVTSDQTGASD